MRAMKVLILLAGIVIFGLLGSPIQAQEAPEAIPPTNTPTPTPTPTVAPTATPAAQIPQRPAAPITPHEGMANCDACGYCNGMTLEEVPDRWQSCRQCIYKNLGSGEINPLENQTLKLVPTPDLFNIYTDLGCVSSQPGVFAQQISSFFFSIVGAIAFLFFIYGSVVIATSRSDPGRLNKGRRIIYGSIAGLLFALFAVFILRFIAQGIGIPNLGG
ncbi:hypothetical protein KBC70_01740 [Candidatus Woesebacteria bacterium]|nr:hypothetical protein [Candidatus Woesebacteria bacterium]